MNTDEISAYCLSCGECCDGTMSGGRVECYDPATRKCASYNERSVFCKIYPFCVTSNEVLILDGECRYVREKGLKHGGVITPEDINHDIFLSSFFDCAKQRFQLNAGTIQIV